MTFELVFALLSFSIFYLQIHNLTALFVKKLILLGNISFFHLFPEFFRYHCVIKSILVQTCFSENFCYCVLAEYEDVFLPKSICDKLV